MKTNPWKKTMVFMLTALLFAACEGPMGPQGPQGETGPRGPEGPQGPEGPGDRGGGEVPALADGVWVNGELAVGEVQWYSFTALEWQKPSITWNHAADGDNTKTGKIKVSAYNADGTLLKYNGGSSNFDGLTSGYTSPYYLADSGKVYIKVENVFAPAAGTYAVKYYTDPFTVTPLPGSNGWQNGTTANSADVHWYSFAATADKLWDIQWNDNADGDSSKSGNIYVSAYQEDGTAFFTWVNNGYTSPQQISDYTGTVYVKVRSYTGSASSTTGTYALHYEPRSPSAPSSVIVVNPPWGDSLAVGIGWNPVAGATGYRVYRSTSSGSGYTKISGDITNGTGYTDSGPLSANTTYYYRVAAYNGNGEGTQSSYSSITTPAAAPGGTFASFTSGAVSLTSGQWTDGTLIAGQKVSYSFTASGGSYGVYCNDSDGGPVSKTADIVVSAWRSDGTPLSTRIDQNHTTPRTISGYTGTVYLVVEGWSNSSNGTYAVKFE
jgi:hypothetical protein